MTAATELLAWQTGTATGGPFGDGRYPLTYADGTTRYVLCPAAAALDPPLDEEPIEVFAETAGAAAVSAAGSATDAEAAKIAAQTSAANAATSAASALASKNTATTQATAATTANTNAQTAKTAAEAAQAAAEAAAASFSAGDYVTKATVQTITAAKTMGADFTINATYNLLIGSQSGGGVGQVRIENATGARLSWTTTGSRRYTAGSDGSSWTLRDESGSADRISVASTGGIDLIGGLHAFSSAGLELGNDTTSQTLDIGSQAGGLSDIRLNSGGNNRWLLRKNAVAESGSDVGSDLQLYRYSDAGAASVVLAVTRSTGVVDFTATPTRSGVALALDNAVAHLADAETLTGAKTFTGGVSLGSAVASGANDVTTHVALYGTTYGFSVTSLRLNYNASSTAEHEFYAGATSLLRVGNSTFSYKGNNIFHGGNKPTMADVSDLPAVAVAAGSSTIVQRHASGYIYANFFNTTAGFVGATAPTAVMVETSSDGFIRKQTPADYKRMTMGIQNVTSAATVTPTTDNDIVAVTAQAAALTIANPTGSTPVQGQGIVLRLKDNGTARAISWGTIYRAMGVTLPTTTVAGKTMYIGMIYNATDTKWDVISVVKEA